MRAAAAVGVTALALLAVLIVLGPAINGGQARANAQGSAVTCLVTWETC